MRVITIVKANNKLEDNITKLLYRLVYNLLYFNNIRDLRLYISFTIEEEVFKLIYNKIRHPRYACTHKKLTKSIYILNIIIKLYKYLRYYLYY